MLFVSVDKKHQCAHRAALNSAEAVLTAPWKRSRNAIHLLTIMCAGRRGSTRQRNHSRDGNNTGTSAIRCFPIVYRKGAEKWLRQFQAICLEIIDSKWWPETGSNRRRRPFQGRALPLSYLANSRTVRALGVLFTLPVGMPFHLPLRLRGRNQTSIGANRRAKQLRQYSIRTSASARASEQVRRPSSGPHHSYLRPAPSEPLAHHPRMELNA